MAGGQAEYLVAYANAAMLIPDAIQGLRPDGRFVLMDLEAAPLPVSPAELISKRLGSQLNGPEYLYEALHFVAQGKVEVVAETFPLTDVQRAFHRVASGDVRFRTVIVRDAA